MTAYYQVSFQKAGGETDFTIVETKQPDVEEILTRDPSQFYKFMNYELNSAVSILSVELLYDGEGFSNYSEKLRYLFMQVEQIGEIGAKLTDLRPGSKMTKKEVNEVVTLEWKLEQLVEKLSMFTTCLSWLENGALREQKMKTSFKRNGSVTRLKDKKLKALLQLKRESAEQEKRKPTGWPKAIGNKLGVPPGID